MREIWQSFTRVFTLFNTIQVSRYEYQKGKLFDYSPPSMAAAATVVVNLSSAHRCIRVVWMYQTPHCVSEKKDMNVVRQRIWFNPTQTDPSGTVILQHPEHILTIITGHIGAIGLRFIKECTV